MKSIILSWALVAVCTLMTLPVQAQDAVKLEIADGLYDAGLKAKMEKSTSALLTEINKAFKENRALNLVSLGLTDTAERGLSALWENTHFYCDDSEVVQSCIRNGNGYQVRQIPLMIKPVGETLDDEYQEAVINYDASGNITRFNFTLSTTVYQNVMKKGKTVTEIARRQEILSYVEQFRTAYNEQDILFLDNIFSEDALIITGSVTEVKKTDGTGITYNKVTYKKQGKQEYINNLKKSFRANKWINVRFDDVKVVKHPNPFNLTFASQIVGPKTDIFTDKGNYLSMAKQKFDINIKNFLWKDYLTKDIQVDDERIASVTLSLSDEAKNYIKLSDTTFPSADSSDGATPVVKKGIVNVSLIVTSTTNIKTTISGTESYILITVKDIWGKTTTAKIAVPIKNKADEDADNAKK